MISVEEFLGSHPSVIGVDADDGGSFSRDARTSRAAVAGVGEVSEVSEAEAGEPAIFVPRAGSSRRRAGWNDAGNGSGDGNGPSEDDRTLRAHGAARRRRARSRGFGRGNAQADGVDDPRDLDACREAALRLLDAAPRPSGALRERLLGKGYAPDVVDEVIERLTRVHLIDDEAYAGSAVRYCVGRLMGRRATVSELVRKGVDRMLAEHAAAQAAEQGMFEDAAWELGRRYAEKTRGLDPDRRRQRFWAAGGRKGHDPQTLSRIAHELFE